jgi:hypothetical protein
MLVSVIPGASMSNSTTNLRLPKSWPAKVCAAMLHVVSLAKYAAVYTRSWAAVYWSRDFSLNISPARRISARWADVQRKLVGLAQWTTSPRSIEMPKNPLAQPM